MSRHRTGASVTRWKEVYEMTTLSHEPSAVDQEKRGWTTQVLVPEMWASLAIIVMWLAVLVDAVYGPNIVNTTGGGTNTSTVPSAVVVALFAFLGTWVVAKFGFSHEHKK
jgi:hypothetical protein